MGAIDDSNTGDVENIKPKRIPQLMHPSIVIVMIFCRHKKITPQFMWRAFYLGQE
jgi:hypothetical protein